MDSYASTDPPEQVIAFYRAHFGREPDGDGEWRWAGPTSESGRTLRVQQPSLPFGFPPGTRTVIYSTYFSR